MVFVTPLLIPLIKHGGFDTVTMNMAIMDVPTLTPLLKALPRLLKKNGKYAPIPSQNLPSFLFHFKKAPSDSFFVPPTPQIRRFRMPSRLLQPWCCPPHVPRRKSEHGSYRNNAFHEYLPLSTYTACEGRGASGSASCTGLFLPFILIFVYNILAIEIPSTSHRHYCRLTKELTDLSGSFLIFCFC